MVKVKEIKVLDPKIKEIKPAKKEEIPFDEEEELEEFIQTAEEEEETTPNLKRIVYRSNEPRKRNLEGLLPIEPTEKDKEEEEKRQEPSPKKDDFYGDSKNQYDGSGSKYNQDHSSPEGLKISKREEEDRLSNKYKPAIKTKKEEDPFENSNNGIIKYRPGR